MFFSPIGCLTRTPYPARDHHNGQLPAPCMQCPHQSRRCPSSFPSSDAWPPAHNPYPTRPCCVASAPRPSPLWNTSGSKKQPTCASPSHKGIAYPGDDKGMGAVVRQLELPRINFSDVDSSLPALLVVMADSKLSVRAYHTMSDESITNLHQFCYLCVHEASRLTDEFLAVSRL
jgi:hypothetical protein